MLTLFVLVGAVVLASCTTNEDAGDGDADQPAGTNGDGGGEDVSTVGQTARTGDMDVTVHSVRDPFTPTNEFETPQPGQRFVAVEAEMTNTSDQPQIFSSVLQAEMTDGQNRRWDIAVAGTDLPQLEGDIPAGQSRRGWLVFAVAQDATGLQLRIKGNPTATGALFQL